MINSAAQWIVLVVLAGWILRQQIQLKSARNLISAEAERKQAHADAFERLTDPAAIMEDMERGADIIEARNANRLTKPREDAGPPAKIHRPKLRAKLPSAWNPPRA